MGLRRYVRVLAALTLCTWVHASTSAAELSLRFTDPQGQPVKNMTAAVIPAGHTAYVTDGLSLDEDPAYVRGSTDENGTVKLKTDAEDFIVVVLHASGYAIVDRDTALKSGEVAITPWGRIEGRVMTGAKPKADEPVTAWVANAPPATSGTPVAGWCFVSGEIKSGRDGTFVVERVPAARVNVASARVWWKHSSLSRPITMAPVEAGKTAPVTLGGRGRPVVGKLEIPESLRAEKDWKFVYCMISRKLPEVPAPVPAEVKAKSLQEQATWWQSFRGSEAERAYRAEQAKGYELGWANTHPFEIEADGSFRIEDVMPGSYVLRVEARVPAAENRPSRSLGDLRAEITVSPFEGERTDTPEVLPPLKWETTRTVRIAAGDAAPAFAVPAFDGSTVSLADFRGKFLVIDFWATWCGPCVAEMPNVIAAHRELSKTDRVAFLSLSLDNEPDAPIAFIAKEKINWRQGYLGDWSNDAVTKAYGVNGIPSLWLIGPDGKVIRRDLSGDDLAAQIDKAVNDYERPKRGATPSGS